MCRCYYKWMRKILEKIDDDKINDLVSFWKTCMLLIDEFDWEQKKIYKINMQW